MPLITGDKNENDNRAIGRAISFLFSVGSQNT